MVGRYPTNWLIGRGPLHRRLLRNFPCSYAATGVCGISHPFGQLFPTNRYVTHALLSRLPLDRPKTTPCDLHVLGTPPAFTLSQDQTLHHEEFSPFTRLFQASKGIKVLKKAVSFQPSAVCLGFKTPTEVVFHTFLFAFLTYLARTITDPRAPSLTTSLVLCSTLLLFRCIIRGNKNPEGHMAHRERR